MRWRVFCLTAFTLGCAESISSDEGDDKGTSDVVEDSAAPGDGDGGGMGSGDDGGGGDGSGDSGGSGDGGAGDDADGSGGDGSGSAGDDGEEEEEAPPVLPMEGAWSLEDSSLVRDVCDVADYQDPGSFIADAYTVAHIDGSTFSLAADGEAPGDCAVSGSRAFRCAAAQVRQDLSGYGIRADMVVDTVFSGTFSADYLSMTGTTDVVVTCDGDCWLVELVLDFPCEMAIDMDLMAD